MKALILSAGVGTRLRPLTDDKPKVMINIGGKSVLEHLIVLCKKHGVEEIVVNLHHFPDKIKSYFGKGGKWGVAIGYSYEEKLLGSGGALKFAEKLLGNEAFFVLNGDVLTNVDLSEMLRFHRKKGGIGTIFVHRTDHPYDSDLVEYDKDYLVKRFFRAKKTDKFKPISKTGTHIFEPQVLNFIPSGVKYSLEKQLIVDLIAKGEKLYAYYSDAYSKDMGTNVRLKQVRRDFKLGRLKK